MDYVEASANPGHPHRPGARSRDATLMMLLALWLSGCTTGAPGLLYPSPHFLLRTEAPESAARVIEAEAHDFLRQAGEYLELSPPPGGLLRIYHFRRRLNLWRHLNGSAPALRWRQAACYETAECYVIALSGRPSSKRFRRKLRHELTHFLLAAHFSSIPPWLDEGLGEVMSSPLPFPRFNPVRGLTPAPSRTRRDDLQRCLDLLRLPAGTLLDREQYRLSRALVACLLRRSGDAAKRLRCQLEAVRPGTDPERSFLPCWGLSPEEACQEATAPESP